MQWHKRIIPALWNAETTGWQDQTQNESCLNIIFLKAWHESQCEGPGFSAHYSRRKKIKRRRRIRRTGGGGEEEEGEGREEEEEVEEEEEKEEEQEEEEEEESLFK